MRKLKQLFMALWLALSWPQSASGTRSTPRMPLVCCVGCTNEPLSAPDRAAMQENLTDKYGIRQIEADE
ncbi:hypothetical protein ABIA22_001780 [Sinorhizobium fredii]